LATLIGVSEDEWAAVTPESFSVAAPTTVNKARWRAGGPEVNPTWLWKSVGVPAAVAKALAGISPGEPVFAGPQP
jgi:hypothetical protein